MRHRLALFRKICRADWKEWTFVKKITLFERSELGIFRKGTSERKESDSLSGRDQRKCPRVKPFRELFLFLFFAVKKRKSVVDIVFTFQQYQKSLNEERKKRFV